jgi:nucleoside-diphosphate-sugar epimerase
LPSRFRRERVLIVGCGDVGLRVAREMKGRVQLLALTSTPRRVAAFRERGITPLAGNLDEPATLRRLCGLATRVVHLAPPASDAQPAWRDLRTASLVRAMRLRTLPASFVYGSTSGVYGNCGGARITEARRTSATTPRAQRRVDAESEVRHFGRATGVRTSVLRIPGIYAPDREGGTPRERLLRGTPVLAREDDVYTNHIHADDLARAVVAAIWRGLPQRVVHASDDTELLMGDWFDLAADRFGLPRPPRIPRAEAEQKLPPQLLGFMRESRRLDNARLKRELRVTLRYPTVREGLG